MMADPGGSRTRYVIGQGQRFAVGGLCVAFVGLAGCPPNGQPEIEFGPVVTLTEAVATLNSNNEPFEAGVQATGYARGHFAGEDGKRRAFDCDAKLLIIPPRHLRFDLQTLGQTQVLFGSNDTRFWLHVVPELDTYWWGNYKDIDPARVDGVPLRPDMVVEALGIQRIWPDTRGSAGPFQRIEGNHQQLLFTAYDEQGQGVLYKEYWLRRTEPRVIDEVLFRDRDGRIVMRSRLSDYRQFEKTEHWVAHRIDVDWPQEDSKLRLTISQWRANPKLHTKLRGFVAPHERGKTYRRVIQINDEG
jgi:hypothetical protein